MLTCPIGTHGSTTFLKIRIKILPAHLSSIKILHIIRNFFLHCIAKRISEVTLGHPCHYIKFLITVTYIYQWFCHFLKSVFSGLKFFFQILYFFFVFIIFACIIYNIACNKCPYVKGTLYTLLLLSSIFRAIITFPIYVYQMLQNLDASSRFMIDERKLGLLFWNTFRLSKKAALFSVFISEKVASSF